MGTMTIDRQTIDRQTIDRQTIDRQTIDRRTIDRQGQLIDKTNFLNFHINISIVNYKI